MRRTWYYWIQVSHRDFREVVIGCDETKSWKRVEAIDGGRVAQVFTFDLGSRQGSRQVGHSSLRWSFRLKNEYSYSAFQQWISYRACWLPCKTKCIRLNLSVPRNSLSRWQGGKLVLYGRVQSLASDGAGKLFRDWGSLYFGVFKVNLQIFKNLEVFFEVDIFKFIFRERNLFWKERFREWGGFHWAVALQVPVW